MLHDLHAGGGGADPKTAVLGLDLPHFGNLLDIDEELRLDQVGFHLNDDVRPTGQYAGGAARARQQRDSRLQRFRRFVPEFDHYSPKLLRFCLASRSCLEITLGPSHANPASVREQRQAGSELTGYRLLISSAAQALRRELWQIHRRLRLSDQFRRQRERVFDDLSVASPVCQVSVSRASFLASAM